MNLYFVDRFPGVQESAASTGFVHTSTLTLFPTWIVWVFVIWIKGYLLKE